MLLDVGKIKGVIMKYSINQIFYDNEDYENISIYCNENGLEIVEIEPDEKGRRFQIVQPSLSINEIKQNRIQELQNLLHKTDYVVTKLAEMQITNNENFSSELARYQETIQNRVAWRSELDRLLNE